MTSARTFSVLAAGLSGTLLAVLCGCSSPPPPEETKVEPTLKPRLVCLRGLKDGAEYPLREGHNYLGRGTKWGSAHVNLTEQELPGHEKIAPEHARLTLENGDFFLEDLNTTRGTYVNGQRLTPGNPQKLKPGDVIEIAAVRLQLLTDPDAKPAKYVPLSPLRLVCVRGNKRGTEYLVFEGENLIGKGSLERTEIDLGDQDETDRPYLSARHAQITAAGDQFTVEDLKSDHGTYVNRNRLPPGSKQALKPGDVLTLGFIRLQAVPADKVRNFKAPRPVRAHLQVVHGAKPQLEYRLHEGENFIGRPGDLAVDLDVSEQEGPDKVRASPQHAVITCADGALTIEDLGSADGTFINRTKINPKTKVPLNVKDTIHIGAVVFRVVIE